MSITVEQSKYMLSLCPYKGTYVDAGAYDGITGSNTLELEQNGWQGICIEPNPKAWAKLIKNRQCKCLNYGISDAPGIKEFIQVDGYAEQISCLIDSAPKGHIDRILLETQRHGGNFKEISVETKTLASIFEQENITNLTYLSIDCECHEYFIIKGIDFSKVNIRYISYEVNPYVNHDAGEILRKNGYFHINTIGVDVFMEKKA